jgi:hypothetical protein
LSTAIVLTLLWGNPELDVLKVRQVVPSKLTNPPPDPGPGGVVKPNHFVLLLSTAIPVDADPPQGNVDAPQS